LRISIDDENAFNYQIVGSAYVNYFVGGAGNDIFIGGDSYNDLNGGLGDDYLVGGAGDDLLHGSLGANSLLGGGGNDRLNLGGFTSYPYTPIYCYNAAYGGNGDDAISVVDGRWVYQSGIIDGGTGYDTLTTDGDLRWYTISNVEKLQGNGLSLHATVSQLNGFQSISAAGITIYVSGSGTLDLGPKLGDPNVGIILFGETSGDLTLLGTKNNDTLVGGQGTNVLYGGDGTDLLYSQGSSSSAAITYAYGGSGNDTLLGGASADCLFGGDGNDAIVSNSALIASPGSSYVDGGSGNDWIKLNGAGDVALGGTGDDAIYAEGTFAYMSGGDGNDTLQGGLSADVLDGGSGTDAITGSAGNDYMLGGGGIDYFFLGGGMQADDVDYIADFTPGEDWLVRSLPMDASVTFIDTAYGVDVVFVIDGLLHQVFLLGVHDINAVKSSSYIYVL
jgi:Ca2+-binding RTX toxin-like protein